MTEEGAALGGLVQRVDRQAHSLERDLEYYSKWEEKEPRWRLWEGSWHKLAALSAEVPEKRRAEGGSDGQKLPTVLQTYTVPLKMVKKDLESWLEPIKAEYRQLTQESQAVRPVKSKSWKPWKAIKPWS